MNVRVTPQVLINQAISSAQQSYARLGVLETQASTGKRINQPSDDPIGALRVLVGEAENARLDAYHQNVSGTQSTLNQSVSTLTEAGQLLAQARDLAIQGANTGNDQTSHQALSDQVDSLLNRLVALSNSKSGDQYLYGGTASLTAPFTVSALDSSGRTAQVTYQGADLRASSPVGQTQTVDTLYNGSEVFQSQQRGPTLIGQTTGAKAGAGTDSATGQGTLVVAHTSTTYTAGSGVQTGTNSAAGDTVLGPSGSHTLKVIDTSGTGAAGTFSLDNGPPVAFTSADTNLSVANGNGAVVFVDASAITAGFNGTVAVAGDGTLSVDGGATSTPITFSSNQVVTNSLTGAVTNIDSTNIVRAGSDHVEYTGTFDTFQILQALRDDLRNVRGLSAAEQASAVAGRIGELERVRTNVLGVVGEQSASLQNIESLDQHISAVQLQTKELIGNIQGADISSVVLNLQQQQNLLQLTFSATSRLFDLSLLNFIK